MTMCILIYDYAYNYNMLFTHDWSSVLGVMCIARFMSHMTKTTSMYACSVCSATIQHVY
jgi:hypothetical protein